MNEKTPVQPNGHDLDAYAADESVELHVELPEGGIDDSWAYLTIHFLAAAPLEDIDRRLNEIGAESWELKASWPVTLNGAACVRMTFAR